MEVPTEGLHEQVARRAELRELLGDLGELPEEQRAALLLAEAADLSHAEVAGVLGCEVARVKALVFRARSGLIERRDARETPCAEIREQLANLRGGSLRRSELRHHLRHCPGCSDYREQVRQQRKMLAVALPVVPSLGLKSSVLSAAGVGGGAAGGAAAAAGGGAAAAGGGGLAFGGSVGSAAIAKVALVSVLAGGGLVAGEAAVERAVRSDSPPAARGCTGGRPRGREGALRTCGRRVPGRPARRAQERRAQPRAPRSRAARGSLARPRECGREGEGQARACAGRRGRPAARSDQAASEGEAAEPAAAVAPRRSGEASPSLRPSRGPRRRSPRPAQGAVSGAGGGERAGRRAGGRTGPGAEGVASGQGQAAEVASRAGSVPSVPILEELEIADEPADWRALGFEVEDGACQVSTVRLRLVGKGPRRGILGWTLGDGEPAARPRRRTRTASCPHRPRGAALAGPRPDGRRAALAGL